jgi:hypothetical protein
MPGLKPTAVYCPELVGAVREYNTQFSILQQFIGDLVLPYWDSPLQRAAFPIISKENWRKPVKTGRAPGSAFSRSTWAWDQGNFVCSENAHEVPIDRKEASSYAAVVNYEEEAAIGADYIVRLGREMRASAALMDPNVFTPHNVGTAWSDLDNAKALADLDAACNALEDQLGVARTQLSLILPRAGWQWLRQQGNVLNVLKNWSSGIQGPESVKAETLRSYLDVKQIIVAAGSYDSADEGQAQNLAQIWPERYGMLALLAPGQQAPRQTLCVGRTIRWTDMMPDDVTIETYTEDGIDSQVIRARQFTDEMVQASFAGYLLDIKKQS